MLQSIPDSPHRLMELTKEGLMLSPGWARVGLTFGDERLRAAALDALALAIADRITTPRQAIDPDQLLLL